MPTNVSIPSLVRAATTVLIIDDDQAVLHSIASVLDVYGIHVEAARDGIEGLKTFRRVSPAVVVTDILMPEQDGIGTIMAMRRERPDVKIIAMSGGGRIGKSDFLEVAKMLGADAALAKPIDVETLVAMIRA